MSQNDDFPFNSAEDAGFLESIELYERVEKENSHVASVNNIDLSYLDFGPKTNTPLIWVPGSGGTRFELLNVTKALVSCGYRVITIDSRGHGKTRLEINKYNVSLYHIADDIAGLMDYLAIDKAVVGGLSKGGWVATAFYDTYPDRVFGLLLEDGGSLSNIKLADDTRLGLVTPGPSPYPPADFLADNSIRFESRFEAVKALWAAYTPALSAERKENYTIEDIAALISFFYQDDRGKWTHHCDIVKLTMGNDSGRTLKESSGFKSPTIYSRLPIMQQSQELMLPIVIFRNLDVPVHIIDPDSPADWMPARSQNEELQALHPDLVVHEVYDYEHSPHEAHYERPERFVESAAALLARVHGHSYS